MYWVSVQNTLEEIKNTQQDLSYSIYASSQLLAKRPPQAKSACSTALMFGQFQIRMRRGYIHYDAYRVTIFRLGLGRQDSFVLQTTCSPRFLERTHRLPEVLKLESPHDPKRESLKDIEMFAGVGIRSLGL